MKKTITILLLMIVMSSISAFAQSCLTPYPIYGKYDYFGLNKGVIKLEANGFGGTYKTEFAVNSKGEYSGDFLELGMPACAYAGVTGKLIACDKPECTYE